MLSIFLLTLILFQFNEANNPCNTRRTESGFVCVCNATYCDTAPVIGNIGETNFKIFTTSLKHPGFNEKKGFLSQIQKPQVGKLEINKRRYQQIYGFGGAFTDATGINIKSLPFEVQDKLMESYFGENGIEYSVCRTPIGGADFSLRPYSYDDHDGDVELKKFALQDEDFKYKIPLIKQAQLLRNGKQLKMFASPWTAPAWMKNNKIWTGYSMLRKENYQVYANYLKKFFEEYEKEGIRFWGLTTGNEPMDGFWSTSHSLINAMGWIPADQIDWIKYNLGPTLKNSSFKDLKIIAHDDVRLTISYVIPQMYRDKEVMKYIDGVGLHWYWDNDVSAEVMELLYNDEKDVFLISSEACIFLAGVDFGSTDRGFQYISSIIEYMNYGFVGWIDWNMALNINGGPTYISFFADSPVIVNATAQEFYKQPMYYAMGHFSKFVLPGSTRVGLDISNVNKNEVKTVAFQRPDNYIVAIVFNNGTSNVILQIGISGYYTEIIDIEAKSMNTIVFNNYGFVKTGIESNNINL